MTDRLNIESLAPKHAALFFDALQDPRIYRYIPEDPPGSVQALSDRYARLEAGSGDPSEVWRNWVMFSNERQAVGTLQASVASAGRATIAYVLLPRFWGFGLAGEGVSWMLGRIRDEHGAVIAEAFIDTRNESSLKLVKRLGFVRSRSIANADFFKGAWSNEYVYAKTLR